MKNEKIIAVTTFYLKIQFCVKNILIDTVNVKKALRLRKELASNYL